MGLQKTNSLRAEKGFTSSWSLRLPWKLCRKVQEAVFFPRTHCISFLRTCLTLPSSWSIY